MKKEQEQKTWSFFAYFEVRRWSIVNSLSNMPSLDPTSVKRSADIEDKFRPRSGKEEIISFSPLKLK